MVTSTGTAGDCFDNAMAESFFATLECELLDGVASALRSRRAWPSSSSWKAGTTRNAVIPPLGYLSPVDFERIVATRSAPATVGEPLPPISDSSALSSMSPNGDSRGRGTRKDILQENSAGQPQGPSEIIQHPPKHDNPYLSTETG